MSSKLAPTAPTPPPATKTTSFPRGINPLSSDPRTHPRAPVHQRSDRLSSSLPTPTEQIAQSRRWRAALNQVRQPLSRLQSQQQLERPLEAPHQRRISWEQRRRASGRRRWSLQMAASTLRKQKGRLARKRSASKSWATTQTPKPLRPPQHQSQRHPKHPPLSRRLPSLHHEVVLDPPLSQSAQNRIWRD